MPVSLGRFALLVQASTDCQERGCYWLHPCLRYRTVSELGGKDKSLGMIHRRALRDLPELSCISSEGMRFGIEPVTERSLRVDRAD